jgi:hypothetical protein
LQHRYKGEEVDFVESYIFPPYDEFDALLKKSWAVAQAGIAATLAEDVARS